LRADRLDPERWIVVVDHDLLDTEFLQAEHKILGGYLAYGHGQLERVFIDLSNEQGAEPGTVSATVVEPK
jgi:hypothetical protein